MDEVKITVLSIILAVYFIIWIRGVHIPETTYWIKSLSVFGVFITQIISDEGGYGYIYFCVYVVLSVKILSGNSEPPVGVVSGLKQVWGHFFDWVAIVYLLGLVWWTIGDWWSLLFLTNIIIHHCYGAGKVFLFRHGESSDVEEVVGRAARY
jgi:hypothetical protein